MNRYALLLSLLLLSSGCESSPTTTGAHAEETDRCRLTEQLEKDLARRRGTTAERVAFHVECLSRSPSHHCTTWARDPGCGEITCPLTASRYLEEVARDQPALLVPCLRDDRPVVRNWVRYALLLEYGDDALKDWDVEGTEASHYRRRADYVAANVHRKAFIERWERFAAGWSVLPRRSPATPLEHGTIPHCWPSNRPPAWWPEDGTDWPRSHPAPTCCEEGRSCRPLDRPRAPRRLPSRERA